MVDTANGMAPWVHHCTWCGWSRDAESATILAPQCGNCGGLLEAAPAVEGTESSPFRTATPRVSPAFGRLIRFAAIVLLLFAAGRFGWGAGGFGLALAAVGVVGLFTVPLIVGE
jgi:hypothetical protein